MPKIVTESRVVGKENVDLSIISNAKGTVNGYFIYKYIYSEFVEFIISKCICCMIVSGLTILH